MNELWERIVLVIAELVAIGLILLFSRKLVIQADKRSSLFTTSLAFFMLFHGAACSSCAGGATSGGEQVAQRTSHTVALDDGGAQELSSTSSPSKTADIALPESLAVGDRWTRFKALWQKLDRIEPKQHETDSFARSFGGPYANALTDEEQQRYRAELAAIFGLSVTDLSRFDWSPVASESEMLDPLTTILARLSLRRIQHMGLPVELMTRMLPPPSSRYRLQVVRMMESRIDSLLDLSKRGDVDPAIARAALEKIQNDLYLSAVLELLSQGNLGYFSPQPASTTAAAQAKATNPSPNVSSESDPLWSEPSAWIRGLDEAYQRNIQAAKASKSSVSAEDISQAYRSVKTKIEELERLRPQIDALVAELER